MTITLELLKVRYRYRQIIPNSVTTAKHLATKSKNTKVHPKPL
ncbi:hypothetical protein ACOWPH_16890 [Anabaena sp. PCC 7938]